MTSAMQRLKRQMRERKRELLDPRFADPRRFPSVGEGMDTDTVHYVKLYEALNHPRRLSKPGFVYLDGEWPL